MNQAALPGLNGIVEPFKFPSAPYEYKVTALRECPMPDNQALCDDPQKAADYWRLHIPTHPYFNSEVECLGALILNTRRRVKGHYLVATGTADTILCHPREVYRVAVATSASAIVVMHNLCAATHKLCYVKRRFMCRGARLPSSV
jgi:hypothetical protein